MRHQSVLERANGKYSVRSQRSLLLEDDLRTKIEKIDLAVATMEKAIVQLKADVAHFTEALVVRNDEVLRGSVDKAIGELAVAKLRLEAYKDERANIQTAVAKLLPSPSEVRARQDLQIQLAELVSDRLRKERQARRLLQELRPLLEKRRELALKIEKAGALLHIAIPNSKLAPSDLDDLLSWAPEQRLWASENWHRHFLGKQGNMKAYVVVDEHLVVDETLVHHGVYRFGENIWLTEKEAYELMRKDRPAKTRRNAWSCSPPSVMPVEDYQAAIRAAREKGISIQEFLFWKEVACEAEAEERYKLGKNVSPLQNVTASPSDNAILGTTIKITARVKRSIQQDREYLPGETIELIGKQQAWRLIDTGAIGPPWIDSAGASAAPPAR